MSPESFSERLLTVEGQVSALQGVPKKVEELTVEVSQRRDETHAALSAIHAVLDAIHIAIREGDEETRRQMRVLDDEVISRIAMLQEALGRPPRKARRKT